jgi:hypothetical protein
MDQSPSIANLAAALAHLQGHLANVAKTSTNSILRNKYADLAAVRDATAGPLADAGLAVVQTAVVLEGGQPGLRTALVHTSGEWIGGTLPLKATGNKGVNDMQALGAAITYARRYGLLAILGLATDDDDGNGAGPMRTEERTHNRLLQTPPAEEPAAEPEPTKTFSQWLDQWSVYLNAHNSRIINHLHGRLAEQKPERFNAKTVEAKREQLEAAWNESRAWFDAAILKYETALTTGRANGHAN